MRKKAIALALISIYLDGTYSTAAESPLTQQLKEQAQFWAQKGNDDNAADAWRKLLRVDPSHSDALTALTIFEAKTGHFDIAKSYFARLRGSNASSEQISLAEKALNGGAQVGVSQLDEARSLARKGDAAAAVASYKNITDPKALKGDAALEYYQTLAGTKEGYLEARSGLKRLHQEHPKKSTYALAYAEVLTYREDSRAEGVKMLEKLVASPEVKKRAQESWKQALEWMASNKSSAPLFKSYLKKYPNDEQIQAKLSADKSKAKQVDEANPSEVALVDTTKPEAKKSEKKSDKKSAVDKENTAEKLRTNGFAALDENEIDTAFGHFSELNKRYPKDPVGYGGLGLVKMRQEEFIEARKLLQKALDLSHAKARQQWQQAFDGASYWAFVEQSREAFEDGESEKGIALLKKAIAINSTEPSAILALADAYQAENDLTQAEANFRKVFDRDNKNARALDGLIGVLVLQKRIADLESLAPMMQARQLAVLSNLKITDMQARAKEAETSGDYAKAQTLLEDAILLKPEDPWLRMQLARIFMSRGMPDQARSLIDALTQVENADPEALYVSALLSEMQQYWWDALLTLERIPQASRKGDMANMQRRLWVHVQLDRIELFAKQGNLTKARSILKEVEAAAGNDGEFLGSVANLHIKFGDQDRGFAMLRQAIQNTAQPSAGLLLQYASSLMRNNQEAELEAIMRKVAAMPKLDPSEVKAFNSLQRILALRYAERARESNELAAAYNYLQPFLIADSNDNLVQLSLARLYSTSGDSESARDIYTKVLASDPENTEVLQGIVFASMQNKEYALAEKHLSKLIKLEPNNPRYLSLAGSLARAQGSNSKALSYFKQALALEQTQATVAGSGINGLRLVSASPSAQGGNDYRNNPFADRATQMASANPATAVRPPVLREVGNAPTNLTLPTSPVTASVAAPPVVSDVKVVEKTGIFAPVGTPLNASKVAATNTSATVNAPAAATPNPVNKGIVLPEIPQLPSQTKPNSTQNFNQTMVASSGLANATVNAPVVTNLPNARIDSKPATTLMQSTGEQVRVAQAQTSMNDLPILNNFRKSSTKSAVSAEEATLIKEIDSINELRKSQLSAGFAVRARSGEKGISQLKDLELPIEGQYSSLGAGQFGMKIIPVVLDAGSFSVNDTNVSGQYGRNAIIVERAKFEELPVTTLLKQRGIAAPSEIKQETRGVALSLSYELSGVKVDVGSSPMGMPFRNVVGGVRWSGQLDEVNLGIEVSRRSVTDSLLAYAGIEDPIYGLKWGGVTRNGIKLDTSWDTDEGGIYASLGYFSLLGHNVARNTQLDIGGGAYLRVAKTNDFSLTTGIGVTSFFYNQNLRYFTYGHGGYFSPKSYVALGIPIEATGRKGKLAYLVGASIGVQHFTEKSARYFPITPSDQAELETFATANPNINVQSFYPGQTKTGISFKLNAAIEYMLSPQVFIGGRVSADNSGDFNDASAGIYLKYSFEPRRSAISFPPVSPKPYFLGN